MINLTNTSTLLSTSDSQILKSSAVKTVIALSFIANNMKDEPTIKDACELYGIEYSKDNAHYEKAKGFHKDFLKPIAAIRQYLTEFMKNFKDIDFSQSHAKVASQILDLQCYGVDDKGNAAAAPKNKTGWMKLLKGFAPKPEQPQEPAPNQPVKGKSKDVGKEATQATADINTAIQQLFDKAQGNHAKFVNGYINELKDLGLPEAHAAKVSTTMLKMLADYDKTIVKAMQK